MGEERRKDKRIREDFGIICRIYRKTELEGDLSKITDFSKSGVCFSCEQELTKNDILQLIFRIPPDFKQKLELFGRVIDSEKTEDNKFKTRVAFIDIDPQSRTALERGIQLSNS